MPRIIPPPPVPPAGAPLKEVAAARDLAHAVAAVTEGRPRLHAAAMARRAEIDAVHAAAFAAWLEAERTTGGPGSRDPPAWGLPSYLKAWPVPPAVACPRCLAAPGRYCLSGLPHGARLILAGGGDPGPNPPFRPTGQALMAAKGYPRGYLEAYPSLFPTTGA